MRIQTPSGTIFECSVDLPIEEKLAFLLSVAKAVEVSNMTKEAPAKELQG